MGKSGGKKIQKGGWLGGWWCSPERKHTCWLPANWLFLFLTTLPCFRLNFLPPPWIALLSLPLCCSPSTLYFIHFCSPSFTPSLTLLYIFCRLYSCSALSHSLPPASAIYFIWPYPFLSYSILLSYGPTTTVRRLARAILISTFLLY